MNITDEFVKMMEQLGERFTVPRIADMFLPPLNKGGQQKDAQFMAMALEDSSVGISYILVPDEKSDAYNALRTEDFAGKDPMPHALEFGTDDPVGKMISMASINAVCQHAMKATGFRFDFVTDPLGLLSIVRGDRVGMVGLFSGLIDTIRRVGAELVIVEKKEHLIKKYEDLPVTLDITKLAHCNKILCTGATVLNNSLDEILAQRSPGSFISVVGPTVGYFPEPLFECGVDVVGGRVVRDSREFLQRLTLKKRWTDSTAKTCFQKATYRSVLNKA